MVKLSAVAALLSQLHAIFALVSHSAQLSLLPAVHVMPILASNINAVSFFYHLSSNYSNSFKQMSNHKESC